MAREMNVDKRISALQSIVMKANNHTQRAQKIADELARSFKDDKTDTGKKARLVAKQAQRVVSSLSKVTSIQL